ncbi:MAG TPA: tetratricopeptide repeat protein [Xanthobacteraceae bacterium]|nr:tetratricopeptide repeat protein [Xanthobacteraceae bacterium]
MQQLLAIFAIVAPLFIAAAAGAAEPVAPAGVIAERSNPCLMAKYGHGQPCQVPLLPESQDTSQPIAAHLARAQFFIDLAELPKALGEADAALEFAPNNPAIRHLAGRLAMSMGDYPRAARDIAIALQQSPDDPNIAASNAALMELQQNFDAALDAFSEILARHPDHAFSRLARAKLFLSLAQPQNAIADLDVLLAGDGTDTALLPLRATAYLQINEPERAIADYTKALAAHPEQLELMLGRATAAMLAGDDNAALADFDTILGPLGGTSRYAIGGDLLAKYRTQRAFVFVHLKRFADAAAEMANALDAGGKPAVLRAQIFLRHNGFPQTPLDGRDSDGLREALQACFGLNSCFQRISEEL